MLKTMKLDDLTIGQAKKLISMFGTLKTSADIGDMINKKVIVRTYSAGVWFGTLEQKEGAEVILRDARRMWRWWAEKSISLSSVAIYGIDQDKSKIAPPVDSVWLEAIEIIPCTHEANVSIDGAPIVEAL